MILYSEKIEQLINVALADGELTEKEKQILFRKAEAEGIDLDEFEMVLDARLYEMKKEAEAAASAVAAQTPPPPPQPMAPPQPMVAPQPTAAPKSQKFGDLQKCPACGAIVKTGLAVCEECGFAFNSNQGNTAMDILNERLSEIDRRYDELKKRKTRSLFSRLVDDDDDIADEFNEKIAAEKMMAIRTVNVPNTRAELLSLLTSLQPICNPKGPKNGLTFDESINLSRAYWDLYSICINKARISFANDKAFEPYFAFFDKKQSKGFFSSIFG